MNKVNVKYVNESGDKETNVVIDTEANNLVSNGQTDGTKEKSKDDERNDLERKNAEIINTLCYDVEPVQIKTQTVWVQFMAPSVRGDGDVFEYTPDRNNFVVLVFSLVLMMLLVTVIFCFLAYHLPHIKKLYTTKSTALIILLGAGIVVTALSYAFACSSCTRVSPCSYICLFITAFAYGAICSYFTIKYETQGVILALITTLAIVIICLGLACTSFDFTKFLLIVIVAMCALCIVSLSLFLYTLITGEKLTVLHMAVIVCGTVLHSVLLVIELQMVLGGKSVELSEDDYAFGAFTVYTSITAIFINLLRLMNME